MKKIVVLVGSFRHGSINQRFARALERLAAGKLQFEFIDISALPHYNEDLLAQKPMPAAAYKQAIAACDGVLIITPEYNRSIPGVLKNALDWGTRPYPENVWRGKPAAMAGASGGAAGTAVAQSQLRSLLPVLDLRVMAQPEVYLQYKPDLISDDFQITNDSTRGFLQGFVDKFAAFVGA